MKIAIVGTSTNLTENEERDVQQMIIFILKKYNPDTDTIISGGARGVDTIAEEIAKEMRFTTLTYKPITENWEGFKKRNLEIANTCDVIYSISIPTHKTKCYHHKKDSGILEHEKTAACWTLEKARLQNKECLVLVTPQR